MWHIGIVGINMLMYKLARHVEIPQFLFKLYIYIYIYIYIYTHTHTHTEVIQ